MADFLVDLKNSLVQGCTIKPKLVSTNTDITGDAVDMSNATGPISAVLNVGTASATTYTLDVKLQSNTTSATTGFTDITGATFTQVVTTQQRVYVRADMPAGHSYVRATGTCGTQVTGFMISCDVYGQKKLVGTTDSGVSRSPST